MYRCEWALAWSSIPGLVKNARLGGLGPRARTTLGSRSHKDQSGAGGGGGGGGARAGGRGCQHLTYIRLRRFNAKNRLIRVASRA